MTPMIAIRSAKKLFSLLVGLGLTQVLLANNSDAPNLNEHPNHIPPVIQSFSPVSAGTGTLVTISGQNFTGSSAVSFGGTPATSFTVVNDQTITAVIGSGSSGLVSVTTPDGTSNLGGFTFCNTSAPTITGPVNVCPFTGNNIPVTYSALSPDATGYNWVLPPNVNLISGAGTSSITVTFNAGFASQANKQIRLTATTDCGPTALAIYYLAVQGPSAPSAIQASAGNICANLTNGQPVSFSIRKVPGASSYNWEAQAGTTSITHPNGPGENDTTVLVTFTTSFSTSPIRVQAVNNCGLSSFRSYNITRNPPSTPSLISGPTNICAYISPSTTAAIYTVPQEAAVSSYTWTLPPGSINVSFPTINSVSFIYPAGYQSGTISVSANNGCGSSVVPRTLKVNNLGQVRPSVRITATDTSICSGASVTFTASFTNGGTLPQFQWFINGQPVIGQTASVFTTNAIADGDEVTAQLTSNDVCAIVTQVLSREIEMNVLPSVNPGVISGPPSLCLGATATYTSDGDGQGEWISSNPAVISINPVTGFATAVSGGVADISYRINSGCNAPQTAVLNVIVISSAAPVVSGPSNVCPYLGNNIQVSFRASARGSSNYNWILPPNVNLISGAGTDNITVTFNAAFLTQTNKQIKVTALSDCGTTAQATFYLLAQRPSTPAMIMASGSSICENVGNPQAPVIYTIQKVDGAAGYNWEAQAGTTTITHLNAPGPDDTAVSIIFDQAFTSSPLTVTAFNNCGTSNPRVLNINRTAPSTPGRITGPTNVCAYVSPSATPATYQVDALSSVETYTWTIPAGATQVVGQGTASISFIYPGGYTGGSISVVASNGCGTSATPRVLNVSVLQPSTPGRITSTLVQTCPNRIYTYSIPAIPANTTQLQWTVPAQASIISGQGSSSIQVSYPATAVTGQVTVQALNNCGSSSIRIVTVTLVACDPAKNGYPMQNAKGYEFSQLNQNIDMEIFPNPSFGQFYVRFTGKDAISTATMNVRDISGRILYQSNIKPGEVKSMADDFKPGIYLLEIRQGNQRVTKKLIRQ